MNLTYVFNILRWYLANIQWIYSVVVDKPYLLVPFQVYTRRRRKRKLNLSSVRRTRRQSRPMTSQKTTSQEMTSPVMISLEMLLLTKMTMTMYPVLLPEWTWQLPSVVPLAKILLSSTSEGTFVAATSAPCATSSSPSRLTRITALSSWQSKKQIEGKRTTRNVPSARSLSGSLERTWERSTIKNRQFSLEDGQEPAQPRRKKKLQRSGRITAEGYVFGIYSMYVNINVGFMSLSIRTGNVTF